MTEIPVSQRYSFEDLVAENDLTQSWVATDRESDRKCFVKTPSLAGSISRVDKESFLKVSFDCQKRLRSHKILRASAMHKENRAVFIEYPYLGSANWKVLSPEILAKHFGTVFPEMCTVMDHIHSVGLIHGDAKLENFLVNLNASHVRLVLADLDFLRPVGRKLTAKIFGTPELIAPEVLANEEITALSDNYSLGLNIQNCLNIIFDTSVGDAGELPDRGKLEDLTSRLTEDDPIHRPQFLLDAIYECRLIDESALHALDHRLLSMQLLASFCSHMRHKGTGQKHFQSFLVDRNRVLGVPDEFLNDFEEAFRENRLKVFKLASELLSRASVRRYADYWHISLSDDLLEEAYTSLKDLGMNADALPVCFPSGVSSDDFKVKREKAISLRDRGHYLKTLLSLKAAEKRLLSRELATDDELTADFYREIADVSAALNRTKEAARYYDLASSHVDRASNVFLELIREAAYQYLLLGRMRDASRLIESGLVQSPQPHNQSSRLELQRLKAWIAGAEGRLDESERALDGLMEKAIEQDDKLLQVRIYNDLGTRYWREGDFSQAEQNYKKSIEIATDENLLPYAVSSLSNMAMLLFEILEYGKSIRYAKLALKSVVHPTDFTKLPFIYRHIMVCHGRLGEYQKTEYWHQMHLSGRFSGYDEKSLGEFLFDGGWMALTRGDFTGARAGFLKAVRLLEKLGASKELGNAYSNLARIASYRADSEGFVHGMNKAKQVYEKLGDQTSLAELELLRFANQVRYDDPRARSRFISVLQRLQEHRTYFLACEGLFEFLIGGDLRITDSDLEQLRPLINLVSKSKAPVCKATTALIAYQNVPEDDRLKNLHLLKSAYKYLQYSGHTFFMMLTSERIAKYYLAVSKEGLAKKFLLHARKLAQRIGNEVTDNALKTQIETISEDQTEKRKMVQTILSISNILQDIHNYEETLDSLIQYAVDVTGAERGVLLLRRQDSADFLVKAYLNCDDDSLKDIVDFSKNVVQSVVESEHPLIIDNALDDKRTKGYKSIVAHNILSVICIPVYKGEEVLGVLYLDHHTIPALFTDEDIDFIHAMANFLSHIISMAKDFKTASVVTNEYLNELRESGVHQPLVTENPMMLTLLNELPRIARSEVSVLITGESGTGKEILCELVHALSNRVEQPLVKLNCAAIPNQEIESELFGVARNAFTGVDEREGKFSAADGGTMFLDEIGDLPVEIQGKVLRVLEYQEFEKRGSNRTITTDVRFIYATNKNLRELMSQGRFREDLFYRVNRIVIEIPPLRERLDDIPLLIDHFASLFSPTVKTVPSFSPDATEALMHYQWPGNVRELRNMVESFCILNPGGLIGISDLPKAMLDSIADHKNGKAVSQSLEKALIRRLLSENNGNKTRVATILGIPLTTLRRRIKRYGIYH